MPAVRSAVVPVVVLVATTLAAAGCSGHRTDPVTEIRGEARLAEVTRPIRGATLVVRLVDPTAGAGDPERASQTHTGLSIDSTQESVPFSLRGRDLDPSTAHRVTVLLDLDGDAAPSTGDYVSTEEQTVDPNDPPEDLQIVLRPVR